MQILSLPAMTSTAHYPENGVWVLGFFDGVHLGHQALLKAARAVARERHTFVGVWTFASLPKAEQRLTDSMERAALLAEHGVQYIAIEKFANVQQLSGEAFFRDILLARLSPCALVCGFNFRFGYRGACSAEDLVRWGQEMQIPVQVVEPYLCGEVPVSSTEIRTCIREGNVEKAAQLLTRPYSIGGTVSHGKALGRKLGFPTANLRLPEKKCAPAPGVYASLVTLPEQKRFMGVCNIGYRPTVNADKNDVTVETWLLDYSGDLYGKEITVALYKKLRDEKKFDSLTALRDQVMEDGQAVRTCFEEEMKLNENCHEP